MPRAPKSENPPTSTRTSGSTTTFAPPMSDGRSIALGATKQRALLAMLALHANETLSVDGLVDGLWGDDPPATAGKMVQLYVSQLRRLLDSGDALIVTHGRGYELRVDDDAVDVACFERLVERAQAV